MEFHLLGSVELSVNGELLAIRSDKRRRLLAALALEVGRPLSHEWLANRIWDEEPPPSALASIYSHVSRIRSELRKAADAEGLSAPRDVPTIDTRSHTYALRTDPQLIDWHRYVDLSRRARQLADNGDDVQARTVLSRAEELWRGEPLAGLPGGWAQSTRATMADQRLATTLLRVEIDLRLGRHSELIPELTALREERPTDERVAAHLLVALHGAGRQAEALAVYPAVVRRLRADLGTAPGAALTRLHERMLRGAPVAELFTRRDPRGAQTPARQATPVRHPEQDSRSNLPAPPHLVGRVAELHRLRSGPTSALAGGGVITVESISGMAGVGKTALALTVAHLLRDEFPEGQYYIPLRAQGGPQPLTSTTAAANLLRLLGVGVADMPSDSADLSALCRKLLAERRAIVVLDDAVGPEQVRDILPSAPTSLVIVTSRRRLTELSRARSLFLDVLPLKDAMDLFAQLIGPERACASSQLAEVVRRCGLLPLAIELAASRLRARPSWSLDHLIQRLSRKSNRLLEIRDGYATVASAFEVSYQELSAEQRRAFRHLGLHPGPDFGLPAATALIDRPLDQTDQILESLLRLHLLQERSPERYQFHDLLQEYAVALAHQEDSADERDGALRRLAGLTLHAGDMADRAVYPNRPRQNLPTPGQFAFPYDTLAELGLREPASARTWLEAERAGLLALAASLRENGLREAAGWLAHVLGADLDSQGYWADAYQAHLASVLHWRATGNTQREAWALLDLGSTLIRLSRYPEAGRTLTHALTLARASADPEAEAEVLGKQAEVHWAQSDLASALAVQLSGMEVRRTLDDHWNTARFLCNIGVIHISMGNHRAALESLTEALPHAQSFSDSSLEFKILNNIGEIRLGMRERRPARKAFERIIRINDGHVSQLDLATIKTNLAATLEIPDEFPAAQDLYHSALTTFRELGSVRHESDAHNGLGDLLESTGSHSEASAHHARALDLARSVGAAREEAAALRGLGRVDLSQGNIERAIDTLTRATDLARQLHAAQEEARAWELLVDAHARLGDTPAARTAARRALTLLHALEVSSPTDLDHLMQAISTETPQL
ncbi:BTAD domain-containing putative transcriptional regulator [Streptomyces sp. BE303]|uniref:AfsR/SARP family transcriptional regulator n=1 Tax=Streptomycetaceae TaxID=2062 RepID=UPI002E76D1AA|nr:BTAD domain-containing putative transcriptional regulator [Streptomyces sp. BE303]MED7947884.1 BTAD domain-containing putative transcriptional regulator [Streptomyces sp. BE303]